MAADSEELEEVFQCIERGNSHEQNKEYWDASAEFSHATTLLRNLADGTLPVDEEATRIAHLYHAKSLEYFHQGRQALIQALTKESREDESKPDDPFKSTLTEDDSECRLRLFMALFTKEVALQSDVPEETVTEKHASLEERLMELNASLPSGFKSDTERMSDINRGLRGLGLSSVIASNEKPKIDLLTIPLSEEEQRAEIIAQAKDEARFEASVGATLTGQVIRKVDDDILDSHALDDDDDDDDDEDEEDDDDDEDSEVDRPTLRNKKVIREEIVKAQVKLAEVMALLDINAAKDEEIEDAAEKPVAVFDLSYGRKLLKESRDCLAKAMNKWPADLDL